MNRLKKILVWLFLIVVVLYLVLCAWFYLQQEKGLFTTVKHPTEYKYHFEQAFEERNIPMKDGKMLNGVLFKADTSKGLILWLPGGRGLLDTIGNDAKYYTTMHYDIFMLNYRSFGKSEGKITSEEQFNQDMQSVYDYFNKEYNNCIVVLGYSLGTGPATILAASRSPKALILQAPYYNFTSFVQQSLPYLPASLLLKYKFQTDRFLPKVKSPVYVIHGEADDKIQVDASLQLKKLFKPGDELVILKGQGHNNFVDNSEYLKELSKILSNVCK
jgi:pimeloyl-ACP methyl ester carboxylesterase